MSLVILNHIAKHAEYAKKFVDTSIREYGIISLEIIGWAQIPADLIQFGLVIVLIFHTDILWQRRKHLEKSQPQV